MSDSIIGISFLDHEVSDPDFSSAERLSDQDRKEIALEAISSEQSISSIANRYQISRPTVYEQKERALSAIHEEFDTNSDAGNVLFTLPVTRSLIIQMVIGLVLICGASFQQVVEFLQSIFGCSICKGTVHNYLQRATEIAREVNEKRDRQLFSEIEVTARDEIFQTSKPVLAEIDTDSTYICLLSEEARRDGESWAIRIMDQQQKGLDPAYSIGDFGRGMRKGADQAGGEVPFHGDVFHPINEFEELVNYVLKKAEKAISERDRLEKKMKQKKEKGEGNTLSRKLANARQKEQELVRLHDDLAALADWFRHDVLSVAGPATQERNELFAFIVQQLQKREENFPDRIRPLRKKLARHRDQLLGFSRVLDQKLEEIAERNDIPRFLVRNLCEMLALDEQSNLKWKRRNELMGKLQESYYEVEQEVREVIREVTRASSIVENLNSRLRRYFFVRRQIGNGYLDLLRFYLNHRRYPRSRRKERVGKSPIQLLSGEDHPHWLELLGFDRFSQN